MIYRKRKLHDNWIFKRGDLYLVSLNPVKGSEQGGRRPVLVLQNNAGNFYAPTLIVAPVTSQSEKRGKAVHYFIDRQGGLFEPSMVLLEQIRTIDKTRVEGYIGKLSRSSMEEIDDILLKSLGIVIPAEMEAP